MGIIFPRLFGPASQDLHDAVQTILYGFLLGWFFLGVALIADVFMNAIETITSKKKRIFDKEKQRHRTIKVWNETVANLTLMALGSSAPEILLNVVEVAKNKFFAGSLGPGTIVGSAAFNLLVISAVCVASIPNGEVRIIHDASVYAVTAAFSLFAYVWLIIVLMVISKNVVEWWEAIVTFLFFPMLVIISFAADKGMIGGVPAMANRQRVVAAEMTREEIAELVTQIQAEFGDVDEETLAILVQKRTAARPSKAARRLERNKKADKGSQSTLWSNSHLPHEGLGKNTNAVVSRASTEAPEGQATIEFATSHYAVKESAKFIVAEIQRHDNCQSAVSVHYRTKEGTATPGKDFIHVQGKLEFASLEKSKKVSVRILDDNEWEQAEDFYIELYEPSCGGNGTIALGANNSTTVTIIDDDDPGILTFENDMVVHDADAEPFVKLKIMRKNGSKGEISCKYATEADSAVAPLDYEAQEGTMTLKDGEMGFDITIVVTARGRYDSTERFRFILTEPDGCRLDATGDGDEESLTCTIELKAKTERKEAMDRLHIALAGNWDKAKLGKDNWKEQFVAACYAGGSREEQKEASKVDMFFHIMALPWKLFFATVPPTEFGGGWWCFCWALAYIGLVTAAIGDLATLFGCALGMPPQVTAITFVALGTSLPDTFASKTAAVQDPYADASITNITGSNSVNVFLGLGLPWCVGAIYWTVNGPTDEWTEKTDPSVITWLGDESKAVYVLMAADLGFSVGVFTATALCAMGALALRRKLFKGELGGPKIPKVVSAIYLVFLWFLYVAASWTYIEVTKDPKD